MTSLSLQPHDVLELSAFVTRFPAALGELTAPSQTLPALLKRDWPAFEGDAKGPVRDLLRVGGFKPSGRNKPASEYVQKAIPAGKLGAINLAVDACNAASFASALPISVVDLDRALGDLQVAIAPAGTAYVFNPSGQIISIGGLICLFDQQGPCANAVKDSQRTKTHPGTLRTLSVVWGTSALPGRATRIAEAYRQALVDAGCTVEEVVPKGRVGQGG